MRAATTALLLLVALLVGLLLRSGGGPPQLESVGPDQTATADGDAGPSVSDERLPRKRLAAEAIGAPPTAGPMQHSVLEVVDPSGEPIAGVACHACTSAGRSVSGPRLASTDVHGQIAWPPADVTAGGAGDYLLSHPDYRPSAVVLDHVTFAGRRRVVLAPALVLRGVVVDDGDRPVPGAVVIASRAGVAVLPRLLGGTPLQPNAQSDAIHVARSDPSGGFAIPGLDSGSYQLHAYSRTYALPATVSASAGSGEVRLRLVPLWGVRLALGDDAVLGCACTYPQHVRSRSAALALEERFGFREGRAELPATSFAWYCAAPGPEAPSFVVHLFLRHSGQVTVPLTLRRLDRGSVERPWVGSGDGAVRSGVLTAEVRDADGRQVPAEVEFGLVDGETYRGQRPSGRLRWGGRLRAFTAREVPAGSYRLQLWSPGARRLAPVEAVATVARGGRTVAVLRCPEVLHQVTLQPPDQSVSGRIDLARSAGGSMQRVDRWAQQAQPRVLWLPSGSYRATFVVHGYHSSAVDFAVPAGTAARVVMPRLRPHP